MGMYPFRPYRERSINWDLRESHIVEALQALGSATAGEIHRYFMRLGYGIDRFQKIETTLKKLYLQGKLTREKMEGFGAYLWSWNSGPSLAAG